MMMLQRSSNAVKTVTGNLLRMSSMVSGAAQKHTLPDLAYDYGALEPAISGKIMELHYKKHHNTYLTNLNVAEEKYAEATAKNDLTTQVSLQSAIRFNGGGHLNHSIFWTNLAPKKQGGGEPPKGPLLDAINAQWGSLPNFITTISNQTTAIQGSGWGWLGYNKQTKRLEITTLPNQDPLQPLTGLVPLLGLDVWEHAYYLDYKNVRADYLKAIWEVVNWKNVAERYQKAQQ